MKKIASLNQVMTILTFAMTIGLASAHANESSVKTLASCEDGKILINQISTPVLRKSGQYGQGPVIAATDIKLQIAIADEEITEKMNVFYNGKNSSDGIFTTNMHYGQKLIAYETHIADTSILTDDFINAKLNNDSVHLYAFQANGSYGMGGYTAVIDKTYTNCSITK